MALNASYMAEQIGLFSVVVGVALPLSGIGFIILALVVLVGRWPQARGELTEPRHEIEIRKGLSKNGSPRQG